MDLVSNSSVKMKNDLEKTKAEEEENLKFEMQTNRFKLNTSDKEKKNVDRKSEFEMETDSLKSRFKLGQDLKSLDKEKKGNYSDKEEEEERMQRKFEEEEYVCCVCGLKGSRLLDYYSCCNEQLAHRYCATKDAAADETINDESLDANGMSNKLSEFFKKLRKRKISVIDYFDHSEET